MNRVNYDNDYVHDDSARNIIAVTSTTTTTTRPTATTIVKFPCRPAQIHVGDMGECCKLAAQNGSAAEPGPNTHFCMFSA